VTEQHVTFCRICEAHCGMIATVEDGQITKLRPDPDNPLSKGYACPKGIAMLDVQNDPDRVVHPLKKGADGEFHRVSWDDALDDIGTRLNAIIASHGRDSIGWYLGNPSAFSYSHVLWRNGFMEALGSPHTYGAGSQDVNNRFAASAMLYGSPVIVPIPDLKRTDLLLIVGGNPLVSHGSLVTAPRIKDELHDIVKRGGRVVVIDPRRTETARAFEHLPIKPDADAWFLLSLINVLVEENLLDEEAIASQSTGWEAVARAAAGFTPESTAERTGIPAEEARRLARDIAAAEGAAVYGRTGSCLGRFGTLVAFLLDALNVATGNLDRPGGAIFGDPPMDLADIAHRIGADTYGTKHSRIGNFPEVLGEMPAAVMAAEMTTPGPGQMRALILSAGNPVVSIPNGEELEEAIQTLDLFISLDLYVNDTNRHADYVLPAATFYEREDLPLFTLSFFATPFIQWTEPVVEPRGEARDDWSIIDAIAKRIGIVPMAEPNLRRLGKLGVKFGPRRLVDLLLRTGPKGDLFGLRRGGLSISKLWKDHPHGLILAEHPRTGVLRKKVRHKDRRIHLDHPQISAEIARLGDVAAPSADFPLRMIGLRELRSHNSWMHNAALLMRGGRTHSLRIHPDDAERIGAQDGGSVRITSKDGSVEVAAKVTDEMTPGTVALPHGWGHQGGWQLANGAGGVNSNLLASTALEDVEPLAGMAHLNGIPVRVEAVSPAPVEDAEAELVAS
jgi:formate dehydrogenase